MPSYSPTNTVLVERCLQGDESAWVTLVERYARLVHSIPGRHGLTQDEVEDVAQDVFLVLARHLHQIQEPESLPKWLMTTARHRSWQLIQKRSKEAPASSDELSDAYPPSIVSSLFSSVPNLSDLTELWDHRETLHHGLQRLSSRCSSLLTLLYLDPEEPSYDEIAQAMSISKGSIGPTRKRCMEQLRDILEGLGFSLNS